MHKATRCLIVQMAERCLKFSANVLRFKQFSGITSIISNAFRAFQNCWALFKAAQPDRADAVVSVPDQTTATAQKSPARGVGTISCFQ